MYTILRGDIIELLGVDIHKDLIIPAKRLIRDKEFKQTEEICLEAVWSDSVALKYIQNPLKRVMTRALACRGVGTYL